MRDVRHPAPLQLGPSMWLMVAASMLFAGSAEADETKVRCQASYEQAQTLRRSEALTSAKAQLQICRETCPVVLVEDCTKWLGEVEALIPTVRLEAKDPAGRTLTDVQISIDGEALRSTETQRAPNSSRVAIAVAPGKRSFRFERVGAEPAVATVELHAGERDRPIVVVLSPLRTTDVVAAPSKVPSIILFGVSGALLLAAGGVAVKGQLDRGDLRDCSPYCEQGRLDSVRTLFWTAGGLAIGGAIAGGIAYVLFPKSRTSREPARTAWSITPTSVGFTVRFQ